MAKSKHSWCRGKTELAIAAAIIVSLPAHAPFARAELSVSPETITIAGNQRNRVTTTLTFSDRTGISSLQAAVSDLRRADGGAQIPANKITIDPDEITVPVDGPAQARLTLNLADASASGEFSGALYLYHESGRQVLPLIVRVKAAPLLPWVVMVAGVLLGTGLSIYRAEGRSRDEIIVQVGRLRTQLRGDTDLDKDFQASIESELVDVESAVEDKNWEAAKAATLEAKGLWIRWRKGREDWIAQLQAGKKLISEHFESCADPIKATVYMQGVSDQIDSIYRQLRTGQYDNPQQLKDDFSDVRRLLSQYREGELLIRQTKQIRKDARLPAREEYWLETIKQLEVELQHLTPDESHFRDWKTSLKEAQTSLLAEIDQVANRESARSSMTPNMTGRSGRGATVTSSPLPSGPAISSILSSEQVDKAAFNMRWFNLVSRVIAIALLAWLGMTELYGNNATFGADPLRDYFAIIAWGFGAELTRESVLRATQDLGLPLTK